MASMVCDVLFSRVAIQTEKVKHCVGDQMYEQARIAQLKGKYVIMPYCLHKLSSSESRKPHH